MFTHKKHMRTYEEATELAQVCARNAHLAMSKEAARELWHMALEYLTEAAKFNRGGKPDIGDPPRLLQE
jgi:hypothetical protein